jgi:hypothetical protein
MPKDALPIPFFQTCRTCGVEKILTETNYYRSRSARFGFLTQCRECQRAAVTARTKVNPRREYRREAARRYYAENRDALREKRREGQRRYYAGNREAILARKRQRRAERKTPPG